eukprot:scaffold91636_cov33-Phaeocystis_antarctica.AAC.1
MREALRVVTVAHGLAPQEAAEGASARGGAAHLVGGTWLEGGASHKVAPVEREAEGLARHAQRRRRAQQSPLIGHLEHAHLAGVITTDPSRARAPGRGDNQVGRLEHAHRMRAEGAARNGDVEAHPIEVPAPRRDEAAAPLRPAVRVHLEYDRLAVVREAAAGA